MVSVYVMGVMVMECTIQCRVMCYLVKRNFHTGLCAV